MPVAMSLTAGTLSGQTHTLRSITSPWEISVMFNPAPSISGAAVCMPTILAPAQCTGKRQQGKERAYGERHRVAGRIDQLAEDRRTGGCCEPLGSVLRAHRARPLQNGPANSGIAVNANPLSTTVITDAASMTGPGPHNRVRWFAANGRCWRPGVGIQTAGEAQSPPAGSRTAL